MQDLQISRRWDDKRIIIPNGYSSLGEPLKWPKLSAKLLSSVGKGLGRRSHCKNQRTAASNPQPIAGHTMKALVSQQQGKGNPPTP